MGSAGVTRGPIPLLRSGLALGRRGAGFQPVQALRSRPRAPKTPNASMEASPPAGEDAGCYNQARYARCSLWSKLGYGVTLW